MDTWPDLDTSACAPLKKLQLRSPLLLELKAKQLNITRRSYLSRIEMMFCIEMIVGVIWKKPGAVHKARFMAKSLYSNVMYAF